MRLQTVPARQGIVWVRQGFRAFFRQPLAFAGLFATFLFAAFACALVPEIGTFIAVGLLPLVSVGFMLATRIALAGAYPTPRVFIEPLRASRKQMIAIIQLGVFYALATLAIMWLSDVLDGGAFEDLMDALPAGQTSPEAAAAPVRALPEVTLLAVTDVALPATARALTLSQRGLRFGEALFLSDRPPPPGTPAAWRPIPPVGSRFEYSRFMLRDLAAHFTTQHVLCVQWDGYVLDPTRWDPAFLDYDYIGAPWPHFADGMRVGNGGFSLRSRRLVEACAALPISSEPEDVAICRTHRRLLEERFGLRFAPEEVAQGFAYERMTPTGGEFGFHGALNMIDLAPSRELACLFAELEPGLLNRREHREIFHRALRRRDLRLAWVIWRRLRHPRARRR